MKRTVAIFILAALVLASGAIWGLNARLDWDIQKMLMIAIGLILVGFAIFIGWKRLRGYMRNEPPEDELSKSIMTKASSISYYISIYLWLVLMYFSDKSELETHTLIGAGIGGMALTFFLSLVGVKLFGIRHE